MPDESKNEDLEETSKEFVSGAPVTGPNAGISDPQNPQKTKPNYMIPKINPEGGAAGTLPGHLLVLADATEQVEKTKLDYEQMGQIIAKDVEKKEEVLSDLRKNLPVEPLQKEDPLVFRMSASCAPICKDSDMAGRVSYCERCQLRVYDLDKMSKTEADELIFKMEGIKPETLYKRTDGKFLIKNCPVGQKRILNVTLLTFIAGMILLTFTWVALSTPVPPRVVPKTNQEGPVEPAQQAQVEAASKTPAATKSTDGWMHLTSRKKRKKNASSNSSSTESERTK